MSCVGLFVHILGVSILALVLSCMCGCPFLLHVDRILVLRFLVCGFFKLVLVFVLPSRCSLRRAPRRGLRAILVSMMSGECMSSAISTLGPATRRPCSSEGESDDCIVLSVSSYDPMLELLL